MVVPTPTAGQGERSFASVSSWVRRFRRNVEKDVRPGRLLDLTIRCELKVSLGTTKKAQSLYKIYEK